MRTFTTERQVRGYLHKVLKASKFKVDSHPTVENPKAPIVVRFDCDGARYRFNASIHLVEKEVPPNYLQLEQTALSIMKRLENGA